MAPIDSGTAGAYAALGLMAVTPIYYGSWGGLKGLKSKAAAKITRSGDEYVSSDEDEEEASEVMSKEDAYMFPVIGSCVLFGTYVIFKYLSAYYFQLLMTAYFSVLGVGALTKIGAAVFKTLTGFRPENFRLLLTKGGEEKFKFRFAYLHIIFAVLSAGFVAFYVYTDNWVASNVLGLAFSTNAIQLLALDSFATGMILLSGLFLYDVFWVFGTEVMVTVAKKFNGPIKVVFPRDLWTSGNWQFTMLGLGDIVIPGIFVALCLRFDYHLALLRLRNETRAGADAAKLTRFPRPYFTACFTAYVLGLITTVVVMHTFQAAQPALLYLSPACILSVLLTAAVRGEFKEVWSYSAGTTAAEDEQELESEVDDLSHSSSSAASSALLGAGSSTHRAQNRKKGTVTDTDEEELNADTESASSSPSKNKKKKRSKKAAA